MKKLTLFLLTLIGVFMFSTAANAYYVYRGGDGYTYGYHHKYRHKHVRVYCKYVPGYWSRGYWHQPHKVCYKRYR